MNEFGALDRLRRLDQAKVGLRAYIHPGRTLIVGFPKMELPPELLRLRRVKTRGGIVSGHSSTNPELDSCRRTRVMDIHL